MSEMDWLAAHQKWTDRALKAEREVAELRAALVTAEKIIGREFPNGQAIIDIRAALAASQETNADLAALPKMTSGYNTLRDALSWFDAHEVESKLGHLPEWAMAARALTSHS
jgi:hypothetical protein